MEMNVADDVIPEWAAVVCGKAECWNGESSVGPLGGAVLAGPALTWPMPRQQSSGAFTPAQSPRDFAQHAVAVRDAAAVATSPAVIRRPNSAAIVTRALRT